MDDGAARPMYHRVLLKLSGEAFAPASGSGISDASTGLIARQLAEVVDIGIQPTVVGRPLAYTPYRAAPRHEVLVPASQADAARAVLVGA